MATEQNNIQINTFNEGMNSDWSYDNLKNSQYIYAINTRINNTQNQGYDDPVIKSGILSPIYLYTSALTQDSQNTKSNLDSFVTGTDNQLYVYKIVSCGDRSIILYKNSKCKLNIASLSYGEQGFKFSPICSIRINNQNYDPKNLSTVLHYESDKVIILYIADGVHKMISINIADIDYLDKLKDENGCIDIGDVTQNNYFPTQKAKILGTTSGKLKTQQAQYTYRFYKKHGNCSQLAPLTNKIQIIDSNRDKEEGNAENTTTSVGIKLQIISDSELKQFDSIQIYRLSYIKANQNAEVQLIYDGTFTTNNNKVEFNFIDDGKDPISNLTLNEFSDLSGLQIIPKVIEQNQNYLFAGNVKDESIIKIDSTKYDFRSFSYHWDDDYLYLTYLDENNELKCQCYLKADITSGGLAETDAFLDQVGQNIGDNYINPYADINHKYDNKLSYRIWKHGDENHIQFDLFPKPVYRPYSDKLILGKTRRILGGIGKLINWSFVVYKHNDSKDSNNIKSYFIECPSDLNVAEEYTLTECNNNPIPKYNTQHGIELQSDDIDYNDPMHSSLLRSLKRGETYRYGIVFFNKYGARSNVQWIADIRTPSVGQLPLYDPDGNKQILGIQFQFNNTSTKLFSTINDFILENSIVGYEIVRCDKTDQYTRNLSQVALASLVQQNLIYENDKSPIYPTGFLTSQKQKVVYTPLYGDTGFPKKMTCAESKDDYFQAYCPEIQVQRKDFLSKIKNLNCNISPVGYVYTNDDSWIKPKDNTSFYKNDRAYDTDTNGPWLYNYFFTNVYEKHEFDYNGTSYQIQDSVSPISFYYFYKYLTIYMGAYIVIGKTQYYGNYLYVDSHYFDLSKQNKINTSHVCTYDKFTNKVYNGYIGANDDITVTEADNGIIKNRFGTEINMVYCNLDYYFDDKEEKQTDYKIEHVIDVKNLNWEDGFSNHTYDGSKIKNAVKKYKSYLSTIGTNQYLNWVCSNKYDIPIGTDEEYGWVDADNSPNYSEPVEFTNVDNSEKHVHRHPSAIGAIGPSGQCFVLKINTRVAGPNPENTPFNKVLFTEQVESTYGEDIATKEGLFNIGTILCNITHFASQFAGTSVDEKKYDIYYGFGNYFNINPTLIEAGTIWDVFDGDVYINKCEFVSMFKAYDFNDDKTSLQSLQIVNYIPMESKINQMFDYGMNYRNTSNPNLQLEPGTIKGICSQERPLNQYNLIYSDNNNSNNIYNVDPEKDSVNEYRQRIFHSLLKTNGENIDNWQIFKSANFIDVNTQYGDITDLYTVQDNLYFWQQYAFGKLAVNERSLVKDENSNNIQLGQGDVLQRSDYISTKYGMRIDDMCKIEADGDIYWFDHYNKCIAAYKSISAGYGRSSMQVVDFSERMNVKTFIRNLYDYNSNQLPTIAYDQMHGELLFAPMQDPKGENSAISFNVKYDIANAFYRYAHPNIYGNKIHQYKNDVLYFFKSEDQIEVGSFGIGNSFYQALNTYISFVVNKSPSITKVFDNQQVVLAKCLYPLGNTGVSNFFVSNSIEFRTDLSSTDSLNVPTYATNREGNIYYSIPRCKDNVQQRLRGKWMVETLIHKVVNDFSISHIITKFRQSYN